MQPLRGPNFQHGVDPCRKLPFSLPQFSPFELLLADYEVAVEEADRAHAIWNEARTDAALHAAEAALDAATSAVDTVGDMILAIPGGSASDFALKAEVLFMPGDADFTEMFCFRPKDLPQFIQEIATWLRNGDFSPARS